MRTGSATSTGPRPRHGLELVHNLLTDGGSPLYDRDAHRRAAGDGAADPRRSGRPLMYDVAAIAIALACFAVVFALLYVLDRV